MPTVKLNGRTGHWEVRVDGRLVYAHTSLEMAKGM